MSSFGTSSPSQTKKRDYNFSTGFSNAITFIIDEDLLVFETLLS